MAKNKTGFFRKIAALTFGLLGLVAGQGKAAPQSGSGLVTVQRDAVAHKFSAPRPVEQSIGSGDKNPYKYYKRERRNQKKYRKFLRQNQQFRRSKKNRLK